MPKNPSDSYQKPDGQPSNKGMKFMQPKNLKDMGTPGGSAKAAGKPANPYPGK